MFEKYTEAARRVIYFARYACHEYSANRIEPKHLALGVTKQGGSLIRVCLQESYTIDGLKTALVAGDVENPRDPTSDVPLSDSSKWVLLKAAEFAGSFGRRYVDVCHILLALMAERDELCPTQTTLSSMIDREKLLRVVTGTDQCEAILLPGNQVRLPLSVLRNLDVEEGDQVRFFMSTEGVIIAKKPKT